MTSFRSATIEVLKKSKKPLDIKEITKKVLERGDIKTKGKTPESTIYAMIITDIKKNPFNPAFIKLDSAAFRFNPKYKEKKKTGKVIPVKKPKEKEEMSVFLLGQIVKIKK